MPSVGETLLIAGSALVLHVFLTADIVAWFRVLPMQWLETMWLQQRTNEWAPWLKWANVALGSLFVLLVTTLMAILLSGGGYMAAVAAVELALFGAWVIYLLRRSTPRLHT